MNTPQLISFFIFMVSMSITPGPNNMMLAASGVNFGFNKTIMHILGIPFGVLTMLGAVAAGLGVIFQKFPIIHQSLKVIGSAYLLYLSYRLAISKTSKNNEEDLNRPMTFIEASLFQFVNPKAWIFSITTIGSFTANVEDYWLAIVQICIISVLVNIPVTSLWCSFGTVIGKLLSNEKSVKYFNISMALLMASCVVFIWS